MKYKFKPSHVVPAFLFVVAVLYGGSKPPCPTNTPPQNANQYESGESPRMMLNRFASIRPIGENSRSVSITNWTARGAWCDWRRIDFPEAFRFPVGTNLVTEVTLMAWGEVRIKSTSTSHFDYSLPLRVSLESNASSVSHGLTPSNSYIFAWENCCIERCATNRANASIELFASGAVAITMQPTNGLPTTIYQLPTTPPDFPGIGQDEDWIRATFPDEADEILSLGYANWLDAWVGTNEANERCKCAVTVAALPEDGSPCYLVSGPYRVNVTEPGVYRFPLEVSTTYRFRTYPTAVPLEFAFDDGYRGNGTSFHVVDGEHPVLEPPRLLMLGAPPPPSSDYWKTIVPDLVVDPTHIPLDQIDNTPLRVWCNIRDFTLATIESAAYICYHVVSRDEAALERAYEAALCYACVQSHNAYMRGEFWIDPPSATNSQNSVTNRTDAWIFSGEPRHTEVRDDDRMIRYATAVSGGDSSDITWSLNLAEGQSVYVAVFMATTEPHAGIVYDDTVSWSVQSNSGGGLSGDTSVFAEQTNLEAAMSLTHHLYNIEYGPLFLAGSRFNPPADDILRLSIHVTATDAVDQLRETCVQVIVYPVDENGQIVGQPDWMTFD